MKKNLLSLVIVFALSLLISQVVLAQTIVGSRHDLSAYSSSHDAQWADYGEVCVYCHTPHNASSLAPLWNRPSSNATYTLYGSPTLDANVEALSDSRPSKLCLSCHDGTIAVDAIHNPPNKYNGPVGDGAMIANNGAGTCGACHTTVNPEILQAAVGTDLSNDHPVSFVYNDALATADGELAVPSTALSGKGGTIDHDLLWNGYFECSSCHDVHNPTNRPFLYRSNDGSELCLTCHIK
jgi:predicted CXXCH cytochrome family protein